MPLSSPHKTGIVISILIFILAAGATAQPGTRAFIDAGCTADIHGLDCGNIGLDYRFNCSGIYNVSDALGNLTPMLPIAECLTYSTNDSNQNPNDSIIQVGCMLPAYKRYIVLEGGEFKLIRNADEFRSYFAPVETPEEALSFAVALTDSIPIYDTSSPPNDYFPIVSSIEPSNAKEVGGGFKVRLFNFNKCGCSTHPYYAVDYLVTRSGEVTELSSQKVYDSSTGICVD